MTTLITAAKETTHSGKCEDFFHNGGQIKYSFVLMLVSLSNIAAMCKIQKNFALK